MNMKSKVYHLALNAIWEILNFVVDKFDKSHDSGSIPLASPVSLLAARNPAQENLKAP